MRGRQGLSLSPEQVGVPVLLAADGHRREAVGRLDRHADHAERFKFVDDAPGSPAHLDLASEQKIMRVSNNRQQCCHLVARHHFEKQKLWLVTGDDNKASGIGGGWGPMNDQLTDELQTLRVNNATGAQIDAAIEALSTVGANSIQVTAGDATLSVADPSPLPPPATPTTLLTYAGPTSNDAVAVSFEQAIGANDALRTGSYSKTLTFTLSTTTPLCEWAARSGAPPTRFSRGRRGARRAPPARARAGSRRRRGLRRARRARRRRCGRPGGGSDRAALDGGADRSSRTSPAAASSPPMITSSGLSRLTAPASAAPTASPASATARRGAAVAGVRRGRAAPRTRRARRGCA